MTVASVPVDALVVDHQNRLQIAGNDIGDNELWNHRGSVEVDYEDLKQIPTPEDTRTYSAISHTDFVETLYKHSDRLMSPKGFHLNGQRYIVGSEGARMFFILYFSNGDTGMNLALAGRNSHDKSMRAGVAAAARVTVCDNTCLMCEDGVAIFRKHSGDATGYLNDQIILGMVRATESWDDMRRQRDTLASQVITVDEGYRLMGLVKAQSSFDKAYNRRLLKTEKEWRSVQDYWEEPKHQYEGGNRTLWSWMNSFTFDFRDLKPEAQLPQHSSLHNQTMLIASRIAAEENHRKRTEQGNLGETIERLVDRDA
jgi:hypothetical protein